MGLLPKETFILPDDLLRAELAPGDADARWWVLHTKPRAEKTLARLFVEHGTSFFLPLHEKQTRRGGRTRRSYLPLFSSYLFLHGDQDARRAALETNLVVQTLTVEDQAQLHTDLMRVFRLMESGEPLTPAHRLKPGTPVVITGGALEGMPGVVLRRGKRWKVYVEVRILQRGVSVEIDAGLLEVVKG